MRRKKMIFSIWEVLFAGVLCLVFLIALTGTQFNIAWYKVGFVTVIWLLCLTLLFVMLKKVESWLERYGKILFPLFCGIWAAALYAFSCFARNQPASDFAMVYEGALNYARGTEVYWPYFALWKNNYPLLLLLTSLIRLSDLLGFADPFYLILCLSVAMVIWSGICVFRLVGYAGKSTACQWMGILLFAGFLPCWGGTQNFYTDTMSLCFGIWACLLCQKAFEKAGGYGLAAGVVWGMGCSIKATVAISMVAVFLIVMMTMQWKQWLRLLLPVGAGFLLILGGGTVLWDQSPCAELEEERTAPLEFWLALGSVNNGSYRENREFASVCEAASGKEAKREIARSYIQENRKELFSLPRLISKTRCNFASGFFGLPDFQRSPGSFAYELFNDYGKYGGYVAMLATGYFYALLIFGILSGILGFRNLIRGGSPEWMILMTQLTIFGLMLFLMIWEANNRQLYNHMPWLALMGVFGISETLEGRTRK